VRVVVVVVVMVVVTAFGESGRTGAKNQECNKGKLLHAPNRSRVGHPNVQIPR
jgi:hypothetical protein